VSTLLVTTARISSFTCNLKPCAYLLWHAKNYADFEEVIRIEIPGYLLQPHGLGHHEPRALRTPAAAEFLLQSIPFFGSMHFEQLIVKKRTFAGECTFFHDLSSLSCGLIASCSVI
jgi:hypothetical protein